MNKGKPKMYITDNFAVVVPMANEQEQFTSFVLQLSATLDRLQSGCVYFIVDRISQDNTLHLCQEFSNKDSRFITIWAPECKNVVDAYMRGYREAYDKGADVIIEMDAGLSHDPRAIPMFLRVLNEGNECAFGSRFINGGSIWDSTYYRIFLSRAGTILSNTLLGTSMADMTSGFQGFHRDIVGKILAYPLLSKAHFFQTEIRYLLRKTRFAEIPIHYRAPSPSVSKRAILNSFEVLLHYLLKRIRWSASIIN